MTLNESTGDAAQAGWPIVSGRYIVGNPDRAVAVCTLASSDLVDQIGAREEIAIVGRLYTLNLGLEKLVWNVIANPAIRFLLLCGDDTSVQISQGIVNLHTRGVDAERRIPDVRGYQPFVHNLTDGEIRAFQHQIELVPLIGETDVEQILTAARRLQTRAPERWGAGLRHPFPAPLAATANRMGEITLDPLGMFLVGVNRERGEIVVDHYGADRRYRSSVAGTDAEAICHTLVREGLISELSHAAYLGRELAKAAEALRLDLAYEQDRPLFPHGQGGRWAPYGGRAERAG
jgi:tetrahydromethanopterin S-methyltransferase subunit A